VPLLLASAVAAFSAVFLLIMLVNLEEKKSKHGSAATEAVNRHASGAPANHALSSFDGSLK
ncbi:MAG: hypothetical protein ABF328_04585, partial [Akkermansiaceae bacterium]